MGQELFNLDDGFPIQNLPAFRDKLTTLQLMADPQILVNQSDAFVQHLLSLFGNVLDYIDVLEQDLFDLKVVLATTVQHSTDIENDLSSQTEIASNKFEKFEFIVNSASDWMALINRDYVYDAVNDSLADAFGKQSTQLIGKSLERVWGTEFFNTTLKSAIASSFEGHDVQEHVSCTLSKNQEKWIEFKYTPYRNPNTQDISHVVCIARDISARRRAEDLLREHTIYLEKVNDAIIVMGLDQKIYYWNKSAERIYGWKREQVIDKKKIEAIIPNAEKVDSILQTVQETGEWRGEMSHITRAKKEIEVDSSWTLMNIRQDEPFVVVTNTDITEKKILEQQFLRIQRMEGIGSVASGIAHDLNNVLSALFMSIRLLKPRCTDEQSSQILDLLDNSAKRGVSLVRQILEFARGIEGNELVIPISKILREIYTFIGSTFPRHITSTCTLSPELWHVIGNPTQLHQVMLNLCVNAKDAMPDGGQLHLEADNITLKEKNLPKSVNARFGNFVRLTVKDSGTGISKAVLSKIFDPFFTTKSDGKGTGLGLSTVQTIVKNHGGFMEIKSKVNKGSEFVIYLPATPPAPHSINNGDTEQYHLNAVRLNRF